MEVLSGSAIVQISVLVVRESEFVFILTVKSKTAPVCMWVVVLGSPAAASLEGFLSLADVTNVFQLR